MRGTIGGAPICLIGAVGFATVAIGFRPFLYSIVSSASRGSSLRLLDPKRLSIRCNLFPAADVLVAACHRTEMLDLGPFPQWDGKHFGNVHPADRVTHQPACPSSRVRSATLSGAVVLWRRRDRPAQNPGEQTAQQPHAPGQKNHPKQKPNNAGKKSHPFALPPGPCNSNPINLQ